jgi:apolipoprotein N-acyltransferase
MKVGFKDIMLAVAAGLLMAAAGPIVIGIWSPEEVLKTPLNEALAWFALVPLFFAIEGRTGKQAFWIGTLAGAVYFAASIYWVTVALTVFGHIPYFAAIPILFLLIFYLAIFWGIAAWLIVLINGSLRTPLTLSAPLVFTALEYLRNYALSGFPWSNIAYTQYRNLAIIQLSSITGIYGVVFLMVLSSALIYEWMAAYQRRRLGRPVVATVVFSALVIFAFGWGVHRAGELKEEARSVPSLRITVLQGNIDQNIKNRSENYRGSIASVYNRLSSDADRKGAEFIIWPEASYPSALPREIDSFAASWSLFEVKRLSAHSLVGVSMYYSEEKRRLLSNSALVLDPALSVVARHDKTHLVPFGEYVPLGLPIEKIVSGVGVFSPGDNLRPAVFEHDGKTVKIGTLICFEGIFPEISRSFAANGANLLVSITNDAWFGPTSAPYQHLYMYVFRAIETGRYVARAANTGVSGYLDPYGRVFARTRLFTEDSVSAEIPLLEKNTIYTRIGDAFAIAISLGAVALLLVAVAIRRTRLVA